MTSRSLISRSRLALALPLLAAGVSLGAENYGARAELRTADGKLYTAAVTISLERMLTAEERDELLAAFKSGDAEALEKALAAQPRIGYVEGGKVKVPIKYAFPRSAGGGKMVTIVCGEPWIYFGGDVPEIKPKEGFVLAYVLLSLDAAGKGTGETVPAAKLIVREDGSLAISEFGAETINLEEVAREK